MVLVLVVLVQTPGLPDLKSTGCPLCGLQTCVLPLPQRPKWGRRGGRRRPCSLTPSSLTPNSKTPNSKITSSRPTKTAKKSKAMCTPRSRTLATTSASGTWNSFSPSPMMRLMMRLMMQPMSTSLLAQLNRQALAQNRQQWDFTRWQLWLPIMQAQMEGGSIWLTTWTPTPCTPPRIPPPKAA